jgi:DnaK suppressor protein
MSSTAHLRDTSLTQRLKALLEIRHQQALDSLRHSEEEQRWLESERPAEAGDLCNQTTSREDLFGRISNHRRLLQRVEAALRRIEYGTFGVCRECGGEIKSKRLEVMPWTEYCLRCQERFEMGVSKPTSAAFRRLPHGQ